MFLKQKCWTDAVFFLTSHFFKNLNYYTFWGPGINSAELWFSIFGKNISCIQLKILRNFQQFSLRFFNIFMLSQVLLTICNCRNWKRKNWQLLTLQKWKMMKLVKSNQTKSKESIRLVIKDSHRKHSGWNV